MPRPRVEEAPGLSLAETLWYLDLIYTVYVGRSVVSSVQCINVELFYLIILKIILKFIIVRNYYFCKNPLRCRVQLCLVILRFRHILNEWSLLLLLLLLKKVGSARLRERDIHPISPKTPPSQYQPIDRKKRKGKRVEDYCRDRVASGNKKALALLLKPASPTPSNTGLARSFQRDTERWMKVLLYCEVLQRGGS